MSKTYQAVPTGASSRWLITQTDKNDRRTVFGSFIATEDEIEELIWTLNRMSYGGETA